MSDTVDPLAPFDRGAGRSSLTVLLHDREESAGFDELLGRGRRAAEGLAARGIGPGDAVGVLGEPSVAFHVGVLGAWGAGAACLPLPPPARLEEPLGWAERTGAVLAAAHARLVLAPSGRAPAELPVPVEGVEALETGARATPEPPDASSPGLILLTSGSSAEPKGVVVSYRAVAARARSQLLEGLDMDRDRFLTWLPPSWSGGFNAQLLRPLAAGVSAVVMPPATALEHPLRWLAEIGRWRATMSGAGNYAYALASTRLERDPPRDLDLSSWTYAWCAGERIEPDTIRRFLDLATPYGVEPGAFIARYSLSECSTIASRRPGEGLLVDSVDERGLAENEARPARGAETRDFVSTGVPLRDVDLRIAGTGGEALPDRRVGEVVVRCPMMMDGYLAEPERTAESIVDGWLRTGDLGYVADGQLYIAGRVKEVIIVHGRNHYAVDLERVAGAVPGLAAEATAAVAVRGSASEEVVILAETELPDGSERDRARREVVRRLWAEAGVRAGRVELVGPGTLPRSRSGKLRRAALREALAAGEMPGGSSGSPG